MVSRRRFIENMVGAAGLIGAGPLVDSVHQGSASAAEVMRLGQTRTGGRIDRAALVARHNPVMRKLDPLAPLSLGNGEFAFTADITGLQTFPDEYKEAMPLCAMAQWGWHTTPLPS